LTQQGGQDEQWQLAAFAGIGRPVQIGLGEIGRQRQMIAHRQTEAGHFLGRLGLDA